MKQSCGNAGDHQPCTVRVEAEEDGDGGCEEPRCIPPVQDFEREAQRDDDNYAYVAAWEYTGAGTAATLHKEDLVFENVHLAQRSYK